MKILIISHMFPPLNQIGSLRVFSFAKYFAEFGHQVDVVTTNKLSIDGNLDFIMINQKYNLYQIDYLPKFIINKLNIKKVSKNVDLSEKSNNGEKLKRIVRVFRKNILGSLFDIRDYWTIKAWRFIKELMLKNKYDVVLSSFSPTSPHYLASKLKKHFPDIFWVADYRDLWSFNPTETLVFPFYYLQRYIEYRTIKNSNLLITVSEPLKDKLIKEFDKKVEVIENGFFPEELVAENSFNKKKTDKIVLSYTGVIYESKMNFNPFFQAIKELLIENGLNFEINFYGYNSYLLAKEIQRCSLGKIINLYPQISRDKIIEIQRTSSGLIFCGWENEDSLGVVSGKIYEYISSGTPIIGIGITNKHYAGRIIQSSNTGFVCGNDSSLIKEAILSLKDFNLGNRNIHEIKKYQRDVLALKILKYINLHLYSK